MVKMSPLRSSNIESVGYDAGSHELHGTFKGGINYVYQGVDEITHQNFIESDSPGAFLHRNIKDRFNFRKE